MSNTLKTVSALATLLASTAISMILAFFLIDQNYTITNHQLATAHTLVYIIPLLTFPIYLLWRMTVAPTIQRGFPRYYTGALLTLTFGLTMVFSYLLSLLTMAQDNTAVFSLIPAWAVVSTIMTLGMALAATVFRPV